MNLVHAVESASRHGRPTWLYTDFPRVLVIGLKRWVAGGAAAVLDPIEATQSVQLMEHEYNLCAVVVHVGSTPNTGHYITIARHQTNEGTWWM